MVLNATDLVSSDVCTHCHYPLSFCTSIDHIDVIRTLVSLTGCFDNNKFTMYLSSALGLLFAVCYYIVSSHVWRGDCSL